MDRVSVVSNSGSHEVTSCMISLVHRTVTIMFGDSNGDVANSHRLVVGHRTQRLWRN